MELDLYAGLTLVLLQNKVYNYLKLLYFRVANIGEKRGAYRVLVGRTGGKRTLGRPKCKWEDNIKMDAKLNTNLLHIHFPLLINALTCFGLYCLPSSGGLSLACAAYVATYMLEIQYMIKIIVMMVRCYSLTYYHNINKLKKDP